MKYKNQFNKSNTDQLNAPHDKYKPMEWDFCISKWITVVMSLTEIINIINNNHSLRLFSENGILNCIILGMYKNIIILSIL